LEAILEGSSELCLFLFEACCFATQEPTGTLGFWFHEYPERKQISQEDKDELRKNL